MSKLRMAWLVSLRRTGVGLLAEDWKLPHFITFFGIWKKKNLSITSPKGVRSNTLKCIWLHSQGKLAHDVSSSCEEIKGLFQHQDSSLPLSIIFFFSVTLTCDWLAVAWMYSYHHTALLWRLADYTQLSFFQSSPTNDISNELWNLITIYTTFIGQNMFQFLSNQLEMVFLHQMEWWPLYLLSLTFCIFFDNSIILLWDKQCSY